MARYVFLLFGLFIFAGQHVEAQNDGFYVAPDSVPDSDLEYIPPGPKARLFAGKPGRAALYSLIVPGAGQAYNKKYWQVPIAWAGVGTAGYFMVRNAKEYNGFNDAYREHLLAEMENRLPEVDAAYEDYSRQELLNYRNRWNRYRQLSIIAFAATWIANSAQAYVGAHLKDFDISDDLTFTLVPVPGNAVAFAMVPVAPAFVWRF